MKKINIILLFMAIIAISVSCTATKRANPYIHRTKPKAGIHYPHNKLDNIYLKTDHNSFNLK